MPLVQKELQNGYISITYRYIRWNINGNKGDMWATQVSEFEICDSNGTTKMPRPSGTSITCNYSYPGYGIENLIDGNVDTQWLVEAATGIIITIDLGEDVDLSTYSRYRRYTNDDRGNVFRDPTNWTIEISSDGNNWTTVSTITNATITVNRKALAGIWDMII